MCELLRRRRQSRRPGHLCFFVLLPGPPRSSADCEHSGLRSSHFENYKAFGNKQAPYRISEDLQPGVTIAATITELSSLAAPDESLFAIAAPSSPGHQIRNSQVNEAIARSIAIDTPEPKWPDVREGKTSGTASVYISVDRSGHVREVWPLSSDNPEISSALQEQLRHSAIQAIREWCTDADGSGVRLRLHLSPGDRQFQC